MSRRMDDLDTVRDSLFDTLPGLPLQDQHDWSRQGPFHNGASHACDEIPSSTGSVTPPSGWPRTDNVRAIYEEHPPSFAQRERAALCPGVIRVGGERWSNGQAESSAALMTSLLKNGWS
jgi:hypothetical protein